MYCVSCDNNKVLKKEFKTIKYKDCGLDNITLCHVLVYKCDKCGEEYINYGDLDKLHSLIASILVTQKKNTLSGKEIRFLRSYLGYSGEIFSDLISCKPETLSRIENEKQNISATLERLIRVIVMNKLPDRDYDLHDVLLQKNASKFKKIFLMSKNGEWAIEKLAA